MTQSIRPSQFITTYGPGSILESKDGPVIIPVPHIGLFGNDNLDPNDFKIDNRRISEFLSTPDSKTCVFRLPTNAECGMTSFQYLYRTKQFPQWKLCLNRGGHNGIDILYDDKKCPVCMDESSGRNNTIRFVMACMNGHLDDVNWDYLVHEGNQCSNSQIGNIPANLRNPRIFQWDRRGGALSNIEIICPRCNNSSNFGSAFYRDWRCSGRNPEQEFVRDPPVRTGCNESARIIQRQAANIRLSEIKTLLSIQSTYTKLHRLVQQESIRVLITTAKSFGNQLRSDEDFEQIINVMKDNEISENTIREFSNASLSEIQEIISYMDAPVPNTYHDIIMDEFKELVRASKDGAPPSNSNSTLNSKPIFEVIKQDIRSFDSPNNGKFKVTPINTLETITVQVGFRRIIADNNDDPDKNLGKFVRIDYHDKLGIRWLPGVSFMGEGIFITLDDESWISDLQGDAVKDWLAAHNQRDDYREFVFRDPKKSRDELHPGFVWWHTLAHLLIRAISEDSGYSTSSIRERIYFSNQDGKPSGGILLYAAQPGTEGTLGGLTGLVPIFDTFLRKALEASQTCSADPICSGQSFNHNKRLYGSCCYGCLMNSETSCEHRNLWLDRTILRENIP